jgi:hypothetical protein
MTHFIPRTKPALVDWLSTYWPSDRRAFCGYTKTKLFAIYYRVIADIRRGKYPGAGAGA